MIYTRDQRDLFARLVGFFSRAGYTIVDAKIHTTRHGYALDSFMLSTSAIAAVTDNDSQPPYGKDIDARRAGRGYLPDQRR
ncbi:MAG: hypothetical protein IPJ27_12280 [Candidatus Accumulibacter sp.]|uniref:ACT domain-containing protein n=1 Tax=Candidatus Accumulibacter proximus TaxID=2954385 RepID=A0A935UHG4_9PROT|nr:hypothetical protein [Candidatus Accumulibacter proximus]